MYMYCDLLFLSVKHKRGIRCANMTACICFDRTFAIRPAARPPLVARALSVNVRVVRSC